MGRGSQKIPVETVHHFQLPTQLFLSQMVQHAGVHQWLHEVASVLGQTQTGQPIIAHPLMVHISISQDLPQRRAKKTCFLSQLYSSSFMTMCIWCLQIQTLGLKNKVLGQSLALLDQHYIFLFIISSYIFMPSIFMPFFDSMWFWSEYTLYLLLKII